MNMNHKRISITQAELEAITGKPDPLSDMLTPKELHDALFDLALDTFSAMLVAAATAKSKQDNAEEGASVVMGLAIEWIRTSTLAVAGLLSDLPPLQHHEIVQQLNGLMRESLHTNIKFMQEGNHHSEFIAAAAQQTRERQESIRMRKFAESIIAQADKEETGATTN